MQDHATCSLVACQHSQLMKALVTGATGFIGGNLVRLLLADGFQVRALVRPNSDQCNLAGLPLEIVTGDLANRQTIWFENRRRFSSA